MLPKFSFSQQLCQDPFTVFQIVYLQPYCPSILTFNCSVSRVSENSPFIHVLPACLHSQLLLPCTFLPLELTSSSFVHIFQGTSTNANSFVKSMLNLFSLFSSVFLQHFFLFTVQYFFIQVDFIRHLQVDFYVKQILNLLKANTFFIYVCQEHSKMSAQWMFNIRNCKQMELSQFGKE